MNLKMLVSSLVLLGFLSHGRADDLWTLLGSGDTTLPGGDVVYVLKGAGGISVNVGLTFGQMKGEGYTSLTARAFKFTENFTTAELKLFASNVIRLSTECFNADPMRGPAIQAWVLSNDAREENIYYTATTHTAEKLFGPLRLELEKRSNGRGHAVGVYLSRTGTPGQTPWIKSCLASG